MSAEWNGDLRNTGPDVFVDTIGILLTACAYSAQIIRLYRSTSTRGISPYYVLFNTLFSNAQFSDALLVAAYAWPTSASPVVKQLGDGSLQGLRAFGAILGLIQIFVQWLCSAIQLLVFVFAQTRDANVWIFRTILTIVLLHAAAVVLPAIIITIPRPAEHSWTTDIAMALMYMSNMIVAPASLVAHFGAQLTQFRQRHGDPGALSLVALGLQVVATAVLGIRWFLRLGRLTWTGYAPPSLWYEWGFPAINYVLLAILSAFLLACYAFMDRRGAADGDSGERAPLLS